MLMKEERIAIVEYGKRLITQQLTTGTGGNISIYDPDQGLMAISPSGIDYFETTPEDVVIMNLAGEIVEGDRKPSSEKDLHIEIYKNKPAARAAVHAHAMYCTVLSCVNEPLRSIHYVLADSGSDLIPVAPYVTYGTKELALACVETMGEGNAVLMANHGMTCCGSSLASAFNLARECEWVAQLQWRAMCIGQPNILTREQMEIVMEKFKTHGQKKEGE